MNFQQYVNDFRGGASKAGAVAVGYAEQIIERLDRLIEETHSEEFTETRRRIPLTLTADESVDIAQIPANQEWELEVVGVLAPTAITINESGSFRFAKQFANADTVSPHIVFQGGNDIDIITTGNASPVRVFIQFKIKTPKPSRALPAAGRWEHRPLNGDPRNDPQEDGRHFGANKVSGRAR